MSDDFQAIVEFANHQEAIRLDVLDPVAFAKRLEDGRPEGVYAPYKFHIVRVDADGNRHATDRKTYQLGGDLLTLEQAKALPGRSNWKQLILEKFRLTSVRQDPNEMRVLCQWRGLPNIEIFHSHEVRLNWPSTPVAEWPNQPEARTAFGIGADGLPSLIVVADPA